MEFLIADTFTDSLARLTGDEQKAVKTTAFDLQLDPSSPGMSFHKLDRAKDKNFWSVRVNARHPADRPQDAGQSAALLRGSPRQGLRLGRAAEAANASQDRCGPARGDPRDGPGNRRPHVRRGRNAEAGSREEAALRQMADDVLLGYGVPAEWLNDVRSATEETLLALTDHLPGEAAEALLELATGGKPRVPQPAVAATNPFDHPDAQRRFRVMANVEELQRALDFPWEKWTVFLHPEQREWVERDYTGPARVSGSAGTGKTIVALHRAVHLARTNPDARVLLTTFSDTLAHALQTKLKRLVSNEPRLAERIDVYSLDAIGLRLYKAHVGPAKLASREVVLELLKDAADAVAGHKFSAQFLLTEWEQLVDAWQLESWEAYRDVARLGRKTRLPEAQRAVLWSIFERVIAGADRKKRDHTRPPVHLAGGRDRQKQESAVRLRGRRRGAGPYASLTCGSSPRSVRIVRTRCFSPATSGNASSSSRSRGKPSAWTFAAGRARFASTIAPLTRSACRRIGLLGPEVTDVDGNSEKRSDTVSVFNGPPPTILKLKSEEEEIKAVGGWLAEQSEGGPPASRDRTLRPVRSRTGPSRCRRERSRNPVQDSR